MHANKITDTEVNKNRIGSLPTRPTASAAFGGKGYTATEMKEAFDKLPMLVIDRFNTLLDDIRRSDEEGLTAAIPTGIYTGHSLQNMLLEIPSGEFAGYLKVGDESLASAIANIYQQLNALKDFLQYYP